MELSINDGNCQITGTVAEMGKLVGEAREAAQNATPTRRLWLRRLADTGARLAKLGGYTELSEPVEAVGEMETPLLLLGPGGDFRRTWPEQTQEASGDRGHATVPA